MPLGAARHLNGLGGLTPCADCLRTNSRAIRFNLAFASFAHFLAFKHYVLADLGWPLSSWRNARGLHKCLACETLAKSKPSTFIRSSLPYDEPIANE
jgi:hypothetical protein